MSPKANKDSVESKLKSWIKHDPDPVTRGHLINLLNRSDTLAIEKLFSSRIRFGTAGLRGQLGPGPNRMNQLTVRRLAIGLASYLGAGSKVVLGRDGRYKSKDFLIEKTKASKLAKKYSTPFYCYSYQNLLLHDD